MNEMEGIQRNEWIRKESEPIRTNRNQSESIGINQNQSESIGMNHNESEMNHNNIKNEIRTRNL